MKYMIRKRVWGELIVVVDALNTKEARQKSKFVLPTEWDFVGRVHNMRITKVPVTKKLDDVIAMKIKEAL